MVLQIIIVSCLCHEYFLSKNSSHVDKLEDSTSIILLTLTALITLHSVTSDDNIGRDMTLLKQNI